MAVFCLTTQQVKIFLNHHHSAGGAQPCGRLCVSSKGPLTRSRWNINELPSGSRAPPRGGAEVDFHGALKLYITQSILMLHTYTTFVMDRTTT